MSQQTICDSCGEPIDTATTYFTAQVRALQEIDGQLIEGAPMQKDYHTDHLPSGGGLDVGVPSLPAIE